MTVIRCRCPLGWLWRFEFARQSLGVSTSNTVTVVGVEFSSGVFCRLLDVSITRRGKGATSGLNPLVHPARTLAHDGSYGVHSRMLMRR